MEQQDIRWLADGLRELSEKVAHHEARIEDLEAAKPLLRRLERQIDRRHAQRVGFIREHKVEILWGLVAIVLLLGLLTGYLTPQEIKSLAFSRVDP